MTPVRDSFHVARRPGCVVSLTCRQLPVTSRDPSPPSQSKDGTRPTGTTSREGGRTPHGGTITTYEITLDNHFKPCGLILSASRIDRRVIHQDYCDCLAWRLRGEDRGSYGDGGMREMDSTKNRLLRGFQEVRTR